MRLSAKFNYFFVYKMLQLLYNVTKQPCMIMGLCFAFSAPKSGAYVYFNGAATARIK